MESQEDIRSPADRPRERSHSDRPRRQRSSSPDRDERRRRRRDRSHSRDRPRDPKDDKEERHRHPDRSRRERRRTSRSRSRDRNRNTDDPPSRPSHHHHHRSSHHHNHDRSHSKRHNRSRSPKRRKPSPSSSPPSPKRSRAPLPSQEASLQLAHGASPSAALAPPPVKEKANFKPTGLLAAETNKVTLGTGAAATEIVLKYHEPAEARKPPASDKWVLFVFKGEQREPLETVHLHERSCWLFGREAAVADVALGHPSCSKQHAVLQFRYTLKRDEFGERKGRVGLYLLDLESSNGTWLNGERVESARYVGVLSGDVVKFGDSEREYVLLLPPKGG